MKPTLTSLLPLLLAASVRAQTAPTLSPAPGATNICPDTPLRLTFDATPTLGTGTIEIHDAADDSLLDSFPVDPPAAPGRAAPAPAPARGPAPTPPIPGKSVAISYPPDATFPAPLSPGMPTRAKSVGGTSFNTYPIMIFGNQVLIIPNRPLPYGKSFYVKIAPSALKLGAADSPGTDATTWRFSTKAAAPAAPAAGSRITVAADGTGDFCTVQAAVDFIPPGNTPITLFIKPGIYYELVNFTGKNNLTFLGEDRKKTVIAYPNNNNFSTAAPQIPALPAPGGPAPGRGAGGGGGGGYRRGLFQAARVTDLTLANLTLHNTTPQGGSQAESIILNGTATARAILTGVDLYSYQDTLQINGQAYISNCYIEGDVDYMWGTGPCFFENCHATTVRSNAYYTQIRNTAANHGYIYKNCTFDGAPGITGNVLSRIAPAQFPASEVVLLDCTLTSAVGDAAWRFDGNAPPVAGNTHFWEYRSHSPTGGPVDTSKRFAASKQLTLPDDADTIKNYANPTWVLGGWTPALAPIITAQPTARLVPGQKATLTVQALGVPDPAYQWLNHGTEIPGATRPTLDIQPALTDQYAVVVSNPSGKVTSTIVTAANP